MFDFLYNLTFYQYMELYYKLEQLQLLVDLIFAFYLLKFCKLTYINLLVN